VKSALGVSAQEGFIYKRGWGCFLYVLGNLKKQVWYLLGCSTAKGLQPFTVPVMVLSQKHCQSYLCCFKIGTS